MSESKVTIPPRVERAIRQILLADYDPFNLKGWPDDEYDYCIEPVYRMLVEGRSEQELTQYLFVTARDHFGAGAETVEHFEMCRPAARKLLELDVR